MAGESERDPQRSVEDELKERTLYFAEVEHKVKTSLSVLQGWVVTLDERWDAMSAEARREGIAIVRRAADTLVAQAEGMLQEARAEVHALELAPDVFDLSEVLHHTARDHRSPMHSIVIEAPAPVRARVDPAALQQVLRHLIENAVKYSPDGGRITLRARVGVGVGVGVGVALLEVEDQGIGLPAEGAELIFQPFRRGSGSGGAKPGVGLGLYIVRKLVEAMDGKVTASSGPEGGSVFVVRLPLA